MKKFEDITITKREILFSVIIIFLMWGFGFVISNSIKDNMNDKLQEYYLAIQIDDEEKFDYAMSTNAGNAIVYGEFNAITPVEGEHILNDYFAIKKVTERYNRHEKWITKKDSDGKEYKELKITYSWDYFDSDTLISNEFNLLNKTFQTSKINLSNWKKLKLEETNVKKEYLSWLSFSSYLYKDGDKWESVGDYRYYYEYIPKSFFGSIFGKLENNTMLNINGSHKVEFYYNKNIEQVIKQKENDNETTLFFFWMIWIIFIGIILYLFVAYENIWLEE